MEGKFPEQMKCPICFEIPQGEIFQCRNGHTICDICAENINRCPHCRVNFQHNNRIRNRALENLLDMISYHCPFKEKGCNKRVTRKNMTQHCESCQFGGDSVKFCKLFGFDCDFRINTRKLNAATSHLRDTGHGLYASGNFIQARFANFYQMSQTGNFSWTPIILKVYNVHLMVTVTSMGNNLGVTCFSFGEFSTNLWVKFCFKTQSQSFPDIEWVTKPICFTKAQDILKTPPHMTSVNLLQKGYLNKNNLNMLIMICGDKNPCPALQAMQSVIMDEAFLSNVPQAPPRKWFRSYTNTNFKVSSNSMRSNGQQTKFHQTKRSSCKSLNDVGHHCW